MAKWHPSGRPTIYVVGPLPSHRRGAPVPASLSLPPRGPRDRVPIGDRHDVLVPERFFAEFNLDVGRVELELVAEPGRTRVVRVTIEETDAGSGVTGVTFDRVRLRALQEQATAYIAGFSSGTRDTQEAATAASRQRVSDERLERVAETARAGGVEAVQEAEHVGRRQAFRLLARAKAAGFDVGGDR